VPVGLLAGLESVAEVVDDPEVGAYLAATMDEEIIAALPLPRAELEAFAADVMRRFRNPYIHHRLESIALNSWPKFAARVLPQLLRFHELYGRLPQRLVIAFAATMLLYRGGVIAVSDDAKTLEWFKQHWSEVTRGARSLDDMVTLWLDYQPLWGRDLNAIPGFAHAVAQAIAEIDLHGIKGTIRRI